MNELYLYLLQAVAMKDMNEARLIAAQLCRDASQDIPPDFLAWLDQHLADSQPQTEPGYSIPSELERLLIFEDVSKTFVPERYWVSEREKKVLDDIISQNEALEMSRNVQSNLRINPQYSLLLFVFTGFVYLMVRVFFRRILGFLHRKSRSRIMTQRFLW